MQRKRRLCSGHNVQFGKDRTHKRVWIKAIKRIEPKKELFVSYGEDYWRKKKKYDKKRQEDQIARPRKRKSLRVRALVTGLSFRS